MELVSMDVKELATEEQQLERKETEVRPSCVEGH
jgi:hypothetical protein